MSCLFTLRIKSDTVSNYLHILQKCFHLALINPFFRNLRKELTKMPKGFLLDSGLRNSLLNNFQQIPDRMDKGEIWETAFFKALAYKYGWDEVFYWRTADGNEVDFVLPQIETPFAVEAKYDEAAIKHSKYKKFQEAYAEIHCISPGSILSMKASSGDLLLNGNSVLKSCSESI